MKNTVLLFSLVMLNGVSLNTAERQTVLLDSKIATYYYNNNLGLTETDIGLDSVINRTTNRLIEPIITNKNIAFLANEISTDFATLYFINELKKERKNREAQELYLHYDNLDIQNSELSTIEMASKDFILVFVPGLFYKRNPENGGDFLKQRVQLNKMGFTTHLIETNEAGTVEENANHITQELRSHFNKGKKIIVISASKGGPDLLYALGHLLDESETENIKAWISIGGVLKGSFIADSYLKGFNKLYAKTILFFIGKRIDFVQDLGTKASAKRNEKINIPKNILTINYIGAPLKHQLNKDVVKLYTKLSQYGPNDGLTTLVDEITDEGIVITELGLDHYYRDPNIERKTIALLYTSLNLIGNR